MSLPTQTKYAENFLPRVFKRFDADVRMKISSSNETNKMHTYAYQHKEYKILVVIPICS